MDTRIKLISAKKFFHLLLGVIFLLVLADILGQVLKYFWGHRSLCGFVWLFYGEEHGNIPNWFKEICMLVIAVNLFFIYRIKKGEQDRFQKHWLFLSVIFLVMHIIQSSDLHNVLSPCIKSALGIKGGFNASWVIPGALVALGLGLYYLPFVIHLPSRIRLLTFIAGLLYVGSALGLETALSFFMIHRGDENFSYAMISAIHETLKMVGLVLFIYAIMDFLESKTNTVALFFSKGSEELR